MEKSKTEGPPAQSEEASAQGKPGWAKKGFDKVWGWGMKLGGPVNKLTNKLGSEAFFPTTLDEESYKAARILRSFCKDGFYAKDDEAANQSGPKSQPKVLKKIPQEVIQNAVGLAIFTTMRWGLHLSGAGGSGVLVARTEDGSWSPPSGILLHTAGFGFLVGLDVYDCVLVINNREALQAFTKVRATIGGELSAAVGPIGGGGMVDSSVRPNQARKPLFTYMKSRGFYAGVQIDGSIVIERDDENSRFYGEKVAVSDILAGNIQHRPPELTMLMETLKAAEGRTDVNEGLMQELDQHPVPGDQYIEQPTDGTAAKIPKEFSNENAKSPKVYPGYSTDALDGQTHPAHAASEYPDPPPYSESQPTGSSQPLQHEEASLPR